jgi:CheY-like chemotaxis protein
VDPDEVRIVVVDDVGDAADTLAELLRAWGLKVWTAGDGAEALRVVEACAPHCVLFDVLMPGMGGEELCRRLRERHGSDIVLIAVTGGSAEDPRVAETFLLVDHYLSKPVDPQRLERLLQPDRR